MSHYKSNSGDGFQPLNPLQQQNTRDHVVDIPLTPIVSHRSKEEDFQTVSSTQVMRPSLQKEGAPTLGPANMFKTGGGRRRLNRASGGAESAKRTVDGEQDALTAIGKFYETVLNFSFITRYLIYILPLALLIAIPVIIGATAAKNAKLGGVRIVWIFSWVEVVWASLWASKIVAKCLPYIFKTLVGVVSSGTRKYYKVIQALEIPLSLIGWSFVSYITFIPMMTRNPTQRAIGDTLTQAWESRLNKVLGAAVLSSLVYFVKCLLVQIISVRYHQVQFALRIKTNKEKIRMLAELYRISRDIFPSYCPEFAEEDYILHTSIAGGFMTPGHRRSGSATPMRVLGQVARVGDNLTSALGNVAKEITGKDVLNPNSAYSIVVDALGRKSSSEALARRIWMSFVEEGKDSLYLDDLIEVMGFDNRAVAREAYAVLDDDDNGDVSLEEMVTSVVGISRESKSLAKSMGDIDSAISSLDNLLAVVVFIVVIFIFVALLNSSFTTTLATAGTALLSLSFVFAMTAQEILGSCIFIFVKHPYDVGDRVDFDGKEYTVEHIALLFTIFRSVLNNKTNQVPNNILNAKSIENVSRSKSMQETIKFNVHFDTSMDDIVLLRNELYIFVEENNRDFRADNLSVEISDMALDKLELKVDIKHKGNWADEMKRLERRNKFMTALVAACRKVPIYGPGAGDPGLGESGKPQFTVSITAAEAQERMQQAAKDKAAKRLAQKQEEAIAAEAEAAQNRESAASSFAHTGASFAGPAITTTFEDEARRSRLSGDSLRRRDVDEVRDMLRRQSTTGRRKRDGSGSPYTSYQPSEGANVSMYPTVSSTSQIQAMPMYTDQRQGPIDRHSSLRGHPSFSQHQLAGQPQYQMQALNQQRPPSPSQPGLPPNHVIPTPPQAQHPGAGPFNRI